jgi:hypothetical protein
MAFAAAATAIVVVIVAQPAPRPQTPTTVLAAQLVGAGASQTTPGQSRVNGSDKRDFTISGQVDGLYPGARRGLVLTVANPNNFVISVQTLTVTVRAPSASGCPASTLSVAPFSGSLLVPANGTAARSVLVTMSPTAVNACQDVTFPLVYSGTAVKP